KLNAPAQGIASVLSPARSPKDFYAVEASGLDQIEEGVDASPGGRGGVAHTVHEHIDLSSRQPAHVDGGNSRAGALHAKTRFFLGEFGHKTGDPLPDFISVDNVHRLTYRLNLRHLPRIGGHGHRLLKGHCFESEFKWLRPFGGTLSGTPAPPAP